jgi:integrase
MTALEDHLAGYLAVRRALGYKLARAEKLLTQFLRWLEDRGELTVTTELALQWATLPLATDSNWHAHRLSVVRGFAAHLHALEPAHQVPPHDLRPQRPRRAVPYLYTDSEVLGLMDAASVIPTPHRAATMRTVIGLLAVTGMRVGEVIRLDLGDIDDDHAVLTIRDTKFGKSRQLAVDQTAIRAVREYLERRDRPVRARGGIHLRHGHEADLLQRASRVQTDRRARWPTAALPSLPPEAARSETQLCGQHAPRRLPGRDRDPGPDRAPEHLSRARSPWIDLLVSASRAGTACPGRRSTPAL